MYSFFANDNIWLHSDDIISTDILIFLGYQI